MEYFDPRGGSNRYQVDTDFFKTWSDEMAYVLGFLYADGDIVDAANSSRTQYIKFSSKDKDILQTIKSVLQSEHPIYYRSPHEISGKNGKIYKSSGLFFLRIGSRRMFSDLKKIGLVPNKSKIIKFPDTVPNKYLSHFIRGYFDGDGSIYMEYRRGIKQKKVFRKARSVFSSGSRLFLEVLSVILSKLIAARHARLYKGDREFQIVYSTKETVKLFKFMYKNACGLFLKRKFDVFEKFFNTRINWLDKKVAEILNRNKQYLASYPSS